VRRLLALTCLLGLAAAPAASAQEAREPFPVEVGQVRLAGGGEKGALLIPVRYPIQLAGQRVELRVALRGNGRLGGRRWRDRGLASAGPTRSPERRRSFVFVHEIALGSKLARQLRGVLARRGRGPKVAVYATAVLDLNRDGAPEVASEDGERQRLRRAGRRACADLPHLRVKPGRRLKTALPACGAPVRWRLGERAEHGAARLRGGKLIYRPAARFRGTESILLRGRARGGGQVTASVEIKVARRGGLVVRAIGDSVTAGFGYYDNGAEMSFDSLFSCKPGKVYNDACSSNSTNTDNKQKGVAYAPDYGLANNVSWVAQWANEHGVTNFQNLAVTGSEPANWTQGGQFYATTKRIESEEPDYVLTTMGANPLLSDMLFGVDNMGCAIWSDVFGKYAECIEEAFAGVALRANLEKLYRELVDNTSATIYLMQYHLSVPSSALLYSATQIAMMGALLNREIASVAEAVDPARERLVAIAPPHFDVGISIEPVYPSTYTCSSLGYLVDGRSVQSSPTQDELRVSHFLSFCPGPKEDPPWVIGGDTGIHPSAAGYAQMAAKVPAPR
jgi:lysophospholipase L1-like esterase